MKILKSLILPIAALIIGSIFLLDPAASAQHESGMGYGYTHAARRQMTSPTMPSVRDRSKVTAGMCRDGRRSVRPPSDAHVLFDGKDLSHWKDCPQHYQHDFFFFFSTISCAPITTSHERRIHRRTGNVRTGKSGKVLHYNSLLSKT